MSGHLYQMSATTDYLVRLDRNASGRLHDDAYAAVGEWGVPPAGCDPETHALLMVMSGYEDDAESLMGRDPGVAEFEVQS